MWVFIFVEVAILVVLLAIGFVTPFDIRGDATWKQWLQIVGGSLMLAAIWPFRNYDPLDTRWRVHPKMFLAGALIFLSTFLTWKPIQKPKDRTRDDDTEE